MQHARIRYSKNIVQVLAMSILNPGDKVKNPTSKKIGTFAEYEKKYPEIYGVIEWSDKTRGTYFLSSIEFMRSLFIREGE